MELARCVSVVEVGPRDGLQNEPFFLNTELKVIDVETGINLNIIRECVDELEKTLKCRVRSHMSGFWKNTCDEPAPS